MRVQNCRVIERNGACRFEAEVSSQATRQERFVPGIEVHYPVAAFPTLGDVWLLALLVPSMYAGEDLRVEAPVSRRILRAARELTRMFGRWHPKILRPVEIEAPQLLPSPAHDENGRTATFFSGGLDSWYSLQRDQDSISALITVKGFDLPTGDRALWPELLRRNREIAAELGKELVVVETDLRQFVDPCQGGFKQPYLGDFWGLYLHGMFLDAVGLCLQSRFCRILVPSSWAYHRLFHWGSHPLIDALLSFSPVEFQHSGAEAGRLDKVRALQSHKLALKHLRVCPVYTPAAYNCCACEKCRRTMLMFHVFGALERVRTFPRPLDLQAFLRDPPAPYLRTLYDGIYEEAVASGQLTLARDIQRLMEDPPPARVPRSERACGWRRWAARMRRSCGKRARALRRLAGFRD